MKNEILIREFKEPWLGTLHLKLIDTVEGEISIAKVYEIVGVDEDYEKGRIGSFVVIEQEKGRIHGGESIDYVKKDIFDIIYRNISKPKRTKKKKVEENINRGRFAIDFFEFSFLAEACIPPRPIARTCFWHDLIDKYYHVLTPGERAKLHEWIKRNPAFSLKNEDCQIFDARFDPKNQYKVKTVFHGEGNEKEAFMWNNEYYFARNKSILKEYITEVTPIEYKPL